MLLTLNYYGAHKIRFIHIKIKACIKYAVNLLFNLFFDPWVKAVREGIIYWVFLLVATQSSYNLTPLFIHFISIKLYGNRYSYFCSATLQHLTWFTHPNNHPLS